MDILNGAIGSTSSATYLGFTSDGDGTLTVDGAGSRWTGTTTLTAGTSGDGTLRVLNGGVVTNTDATLGSAAGTTGTALVSGQGATWTNSGGLWVGYSGVGTLSVLSGGTVACGTGGGWDGLYLGSEVGSSGSACISGTGALVTTAATYYYDFIGAKGTGLLEITRGGEYRSQSPGISIGANAEGDGTVRISGTGSRWTSVGTVLVGTNGGGSVTATDGAYVACANLTVGAESTATGHVDLRGAGTQWDVSDTVTVGQDCLYGTLTIADGARLTSSHGLLGAWTRPPQAGARRPSPACNRGGK